MHRARTRYQTRPGSASNPSEANDKEFFVVTSDRIDTLTAPYLPDDWSEVDARAVDTARGLRTDVHRRPLGRRGRPPARTNSARVGLHGRQESEVRRHPLGHRSCRPRDRQHRTRRNDRRRPRSRHNSWQHHRGHVLTCIVGLLRPAGHRHRSHRCVRGPGSRRRREVRTILDRTPRIHRPGTGAAGGRRPLVRP